jgi:hypothetical protein
MWPFKKRARPFSFPTTYGRFRRARLAFSPSIFTHPELSIRRPDLSTRTVGFLAQRFYPPGIVHTPPGPLYALQERFSLLPSGVTNILNGVVLAVVDALTVPNPNVPNGITIFPGGFPLYRNGVLVGAIGVSGDGIDQDDIIAAAGTVGFLPPPDIRADHQRYRGARLPYAKFPRNPDL